MVSFNNEPKQTLNSAQRFSQIETNNEIDFNYVVSLRILGKNNESLVAVNKLLELNPNNITAISLKG